MERVSLKDLPVREHADFGADCKDWIHCDWQYNSMTTKRRCSYCWRLETIVTPNKTTER